LLAIFILVALVPPVRTAITRRRASTADSRPKELV